MRAWQEARKLAGLSCGALERLPRKEQGVLVARWRRAVYSIELNLAEGAAQRHPAQLRRYVGAARGSLDELEAILVLVGACGYLSAPDVAPIEHSRAHCARLVAGLLRERDEASE